VIGARCREGGANAKVQKCSGGASEQMTVQRCRVAGAGTGVPIWRC